MKKRILALLLCVAVLLVLLPQTRSAAAGRLSFVSINDTLPPELINTVVYYGDRVYAPYWLFTGYGFGISYVYFASASTAYLSSGDRQLFFDLSTGKTYDGDDWHYDTSAIVQGGTVYLPLGFMCSFFGGMRYSTIAGNEYGSILRITTGAEVLTDAEFFRAAQNVMRTYYQNYNKGSGGSTRPPDWPPEQPAHAGDMVRLALLGLPEEAALERLQRMKAEAGFFLTGEQARSDPDLVRRIACSGYGLGVACPTGTAAEYRETAALLWEIARVRAELVWLPEGAAAPAGAARLAWDAGFDSAEAPEEAARELTAQLELGRDDVTVIFPCAAPAETLETLLEYLGSNGFTVAAPRPTDSAAD